MWRQRELFSLSHLPYPEESDPFSEASADPGNTQQVTRPYTCATDALLVILAALGTPNPSSLSASLANPYPPRVSATTTRLPKSRSLDRNKRRAATISLFFWRERGILISTLGIESVNFLQKPALHHRPLEGHDVFLRSAERPM